MTWNASSAVERLAVRPHSKSQIVISFLSLTFNCKVNLTEYLN